MAEVRPLVNILRLRGYPILKMLQLEEALLRTDDRNWLLLNEGTDRPAIVMGISGKPPALLNLPLVRKLGIPVIKRFSGGGTVVVDGDTLFATLLMRQDDLDVRPYPRDIMSYMETFYQDVFTDVSSEGFRLKENDFVIGERKFGGNAQSITKRRWLHHTSFLWDFHDGHMELLKHPDRAPEYRKGRAHGAFLCKLKEHFTARGTFLDAVDSNAESLFELSEASLEHANEALERKHQTSTRLLTPEELQSEDPSIGAADIYEVDSASSVIRT